MPPPPPKKQICQSLTKASTTSTSTSPPTPTPVVHSIHSRSPNSASAYGSKFHDGSNGKSNSGGAHSSPKPDLTDRQEDAKDGQGKTPFSLSTSPTVHKSPRSLFSAYDRLKSESAKSESSSSKELKIYEPISPVSADHQDENSCSKPGSLRCDYVKVIVSATPKDQQVKAQVNSHQSSPPPSPVIIRSNPDQLTLQLKRIFTDSYLLQAWEKCQYIDLFLYSSVGKPSVQSLIPAHRLLLSAYSEHAKQFIKSYPDPVKFVDQLQTFLKEHNGGETPIDMHSLTLSALSCTTIPVLVLTVPQQDLHDLVMLMYRGEVAVNKSRIGSMQRSAHELKMSSITILETSQVLIDSNGIPVYSSEYSSESSLCSSSESTSQQGSSSSTASMPHKCNLSCGNCCYQNNMTNKLSSKSTVEHIREVSSPLLKMDLDSSFSSSSNSSGSISGDDLSQCGELSPPVIVVEEDEDDEESRENTLLDMTHKRDLAEFLRDNPPSLAIPKTKGVSVLANVFAAPKLLQQPNFDVLGQHGLYPNKTTTAPHLISRSHSLNELMDQHRSYLRNHHHPHLQIPESPLSGYKRKDPPSPYGHFSGLLTPTPTPTSLMNGLDFSSAAAVAAAASAHASPNSNSDAFMVTSMKTTNPLLSLPTPPPSASATSPKFMSSPLGGGSSPSPLGPFFMKNPFEAAAAAAAATSCQSPLFRSGFPFQSPTTGSPFQRQFSAPANLNSFANHHGEMSPLIYDHTHSQSQNSIAPEFQKSRRGRKPASAYLNTNSVSTASAEPTSPGLYSGECSLFGASDRSESPKSETHHQCGANGWLTTAGSGANCRKRCQNLYHAAKYRDRRRQRMEQLYSEKDGLEKAQSLFVSKMNSLKMQICSLITQRTQKLGRNGTTVSFQCPVCQAAFYDVELIRLHLSNEHYDIQRSLSQINPATIATATTISTVPTTAKSSSTTTSSPIVATTASPIVAETVSAVPPAQPVPVTSYDYHQNIALQTFQIMTKTWLDRTKALEAVEELGKNKRIAEETTQLMEVAKAIQVPSSKPSSGLFGGTPTLSALPMIPFN